MYLTDPPKRFQLEQGALVKVSGGEQGGLVGVSGGEQGAMVGGSGGTSVGGMPLDPVGVYINGAAGFEVTLWGGLEAG